MAEGVCDVVDAVVVGAVGAVAVFGETGREVVIVRVSENGEVVGDSLMCVVVEEEREDVGWLVDAEGRGERVFVVECEFEDKFGLGFGFECDGVHEYHYNNFSFC